MSSLLTFQRARMFVRSRHLAVKMATSPAPATVLGRRWFSGAAPAPATLLGRRLFSGRPKEKDPPPNRDKIPKPEYVYVRDGSKHKTERKLLEFHSAKLWKDRIMTAKLWRYCPGCKNYYKTEEEVKKHQQSGDCPQTTQLIEAWNSGRLSKDGTIFPTRKEMLREEMKRGGADSGGVDSEANSGGADSGGVDSEADSGGADSGGVDNEADSGGADSGGTNKSQ